MNYKDYRDILSMHYNARHKRNSSYSLKAYSRDLGLKINISDVFNRRYGISVNTAKKIADNLELDPDTRSQLILLVQSEHAKSLTLRQQAREELRETTYLDHYELKEDEFSILDKWYYLALKELASKKDFVFEPQWIKQKLDITEEEAQEAIEALFKASIFTKDKNNYPILNKNIESVQVQCSDKIRKYHHDHLHKALETLEKVDSKNRDYATGHLIINKNRIQEVREKIRQFRRSLYEKYEASEYELSQESSKLYCISTQLYPLEH